MMFHSLIRDTVVCMYDREKGKILQPADMWAGERREGFRVMHAPNECSWSRDRLLAASKISIAVRRAHQEADVAIMPSCGSPDRDNQRSRDLRVTIVINPITGCNSGHGSVAVKYLPTWGACLSKTDKVENTWLWMGWILMSPRALLKVMIAFHWSTP